MPSLQVPQWLRRPKRTTLTTHLTALEGPSVPVGADPTNPNIGVGVAAETNIQAEEPYPKFLMNLSRQTLPSWVEMDG